MKKKEIQLLFEYNAWANGRILATAAKLTPEQLEPSTTHGHGDLLGTLLHTLDAEFGWRMLCQHSAGSPILERDSFPTVAALESRWQEEMALMADYLAGLEDDDITAFVRYETDEKKKRERVLWHCLYHVVNHGTQHRSEAAALMTEKGQSPGELDFTYFMSERE